jgi:hypothetical protein
MTYIGNQLENSTKGAIKVDNLIGVSYTIIGLLDNISAKFTM